jgi:hypothetical protein
LHYWCLLSFFILRNLSPFFLSEYKITFDALLFLTAAHLLISHKNFDSFISYHVYSYFMDIIWWSL